MTTTLRPGRFRITSIVALGEGGFGRVDRVRITESNCHGKPVGSEWARKRLNDKWRQHPEAVERFRREIDAVQSMTHENIVGCEGTNLEGDEPFYLMPLYSSSVRRLIASHTGGTDWRHVAGWGAVLADALQYAHGMRRIHRDIKPENLLFNPEGPLTITDWGIGYFVHRASVVLTALTRGGMGTEYYCSREQWLTGKCDNRGDIYSLGMTLDEWTTGRQRTIAFGGGVSGPSAPPTSVGARLFNETIAAMTSPTAADRPSTMRTVAQALRHVAAER